MMPGLRRRRAARLVSTGPAPLLHRLHEDVNPRHACCVHCRRTWAPADCPLTEHDPCPECNPTPCLGCGALTWGGLHRDGQHACDAWQAPSNQESA